MKNDHELASYDENLIINLSKVDAKGGGNKPHYRTRGINIRMSCVLRMRRRGFENAKRRFLGMVAGGRIELPTKGL